MIIPFLIVAAGAPSLEESFDSNPIAIIEVPDMSRSFPGLEQVSRGLGFQTFSERERDVLRAAGLRVFGAWYGDIASRSEADVVVALDAQREFESVRRVTQAWLRKRGAALGEPVPISDGWAVRTVDGLNSSLTFGWNAEHRRLGWATRRTRVLALSESHPSSLADDDVFRTMVDFSPDAELRGVVHVPRVLAWLLRQPKGQSLARVVSRLGLGGVQAMPFALERTSPRRGRLRVETSFTGDARGLLAAFGPAISARWPRDVPSDAQGFTVLSVIPENFYRALSDALAADNPLRFALVQAQIAALEQQVKKSFGRDVLGSEARKWVAYGDSSGRWVMELALRDPEAARQMVELFRESYPSLTIEPLQVAGVAAYRFRIEGHQASLAFLADSVVIAEDDQALRQRLSTTTRGKFPRTIERGTAIAYGQGPIGWTGLTEGGSSSRQDAVGFRFERNGRKLRFEVQMQR